MPMQKIYLGSFHPYLEDALCDRIECLRKEDPFSPIAVVAPSASIRSRLKILLTKERGLNLAGVHFFTFHNLAVRLCEERYGTADNFITDDFFFSEFLRRLLKEDVPGADTFRYFSETPEGCGALWATLRDMRDARADPDILIEALREDIFKKENISKLTPLISLYKEFFSRIKDLGISGYSDISETAEELAPSSNLLQSFKEIIYYGFYDLTQVQYDLFHAVAQNYPSSLYFPLIETMPAFTFAKRFYERFIQGLIHGEGNIVRLSGHTETPAKAGTMFPFGHLSTIISVSGAEDEVLTVAKGILRLVEDDGYSFSDIGVVAREMDSYGLLIERIFRTHRIPFVSSAGVPANRYQNTKAVHLLISVLKDDFRRTDVIDLVSSYYCRIQSFCPAGTDPAPDVWDLITCEAGISKGFDEWRRLDKYIRDGDVLHKSHKSEDEDGEDQVIRGEQIAPLMAFIMSLKDDLDALPEVSSWPDYVDRFMVLIKKYLEVEGFIEDALLSLKTFDLVSEKVTLNEFEDTFIRRLEKMSIPIGDDNIAGIRVLDAMSARGIPFKVLFILNMNEKVFPRNISEDPLLKDSVRRIMESDLGFKITFKITEKLYGYEEEKLLFYMLLSSASDRIYILYQRTDEAGQTKIPSGYLSEIGKGFPVKEINIPRRLSDKFSAPDSSEYFSYRLLTPKELAVRLILEKTDPSHLISRFDLNPVLYKHGLRYLRQIEDMKPELTGVDGITGPLNSYWQGIRSSGISPTSLEKYARCPFSYFMSHVLGLRKLIRPENVYEISPADTGTICHRILRRYYSRWNSGTEFSSVTEFNSVPNTRLLDEDASAEFNEFQMDNQTGYPLVWEILKKRLVSVLKSVIEEDIRELSSSGFKPFAFEVNEASPFAGDVPEVMSDIFIHGIIDRIDIRPDTGEFRVIDYKFKAGRSISNDDKNLPMSSVRGKRLQPPLYLLMASPYLKKTGFKEPVPDKVSFYFIAPGWDSNSEGEVRSEFPGNCWDSPLGSQINATVALLLKGIKEGLFFIIPGTYCEHCDYYTICRKNHYPSFLRAERDGRVRPYISVRYNKP